MRISCDIQYYVFLRERERERQTDRQKKSNSIKINRRRQCIHNTRCVLQHYTESTQINPNDHWYWRLWTISSCIPLQHPLLYINQTKTHVDNERYHVNVAINIGPNRRDFLTNALRISTFRGGGG